MRIGIIGAGKVGVTLGKYLTDAGISVTGFYSRTKGSAVSAAEFIKKAVYDNLNDLVNASDTLFITTPDEEICHVWDCIAGDHLSGKVICHFSGSLSSNVFSGIEGTGAAGCSIHPMYAFSGKFTSYRQFHTAYLIMEGNERAQEPMRKLFGGLGHTILTMRAEHKVKYHAAAALASNGMIGLFQVCLDLLSECGFEEEDSRAFLQPLVENNISAMLEHGPTQALTGPIERGDVQTVQKHLDALAGGEAEGIYRSLGNVLLDIAGRRHPERDDTALQKCLALDQI